MKSWIGAVALVALSACTTTQVDLATAPHVAHDRVQALRLLEPGPETVPVIISYDRTNDAMTMSFMVYLDWEPVAYMREGEQLRIFVSPGRHILSAVGSKRKDSPMSVSVTDQFSSESRHEYRISPYGPRLTPM